MELFSPDMSLISWTVISIIMILLPVIALLYLMKSNSKDTTNKLIWVLIIIFIPILGSLIYFSMKLKDWIKQKIKR